MKNQTTKIVSDISDKVTGTAPAEPPPATAAEIAAATDHLVNALGVDPRHVARLLLICKTLAEAEGSVRFDLQIHIAQVLAPCLPGFSGFIDGGAAQALADLRAGGE